MRNEGNIYFQIIMSYFRFPNLHIPYTLVLYSHLFHISYELFTSSPLSSFHFPSDLSALLTFYCLFASLPFSMLLLRIFFYFHLSLLLDICVNFIYTIDKAMYKIYNQNLSRTRSKNANTFLHKALFFYHHLILFK